MRYRAHSNSKGTLAILDEGCAKYALKGHLMAISTVINADQVSTKRKCAHNASTSFTRYPWITSKYIEDKKWRTFSNARFAVNCWLNQRRATTVRVITVLSASQENWTRLIGVPNAASISQQWRTCLKDLGSHSMKSCLSVGVSMLTLHLLIMQSRVVVRLWAMEIMTGTYFMPAQIGVKHANSYAIKSQLWRTNLRVSVWMVQTDIQGELLETDLFQTTHSNQCQMKATMIHTCHREPWTRKRMTILGQVAVFSSTLPSFCKTNNDSKLQATLKESPKTCQTLLENRRNALLSSCLSMFSSRTWYSTSFGSLLFQSKLLRKRLSTQTRSSTLVHKGSHSLSTWQCTHWSLSLHNSSLLYWLLRRNLLIQDQFVLAANFC